MTRNIMYYCESSGPGGTHYEVRVWDDVSKTDMRVSDRVFGGSRVPLTRIARKPVLRFYVDSAADGSGGWSVMDRLHGIPVGTFACISDAEWFRDEKNSVYSALVPAYNVNV